MTIPFLPDVTEKVREEARIGLNRVTVADVLETVKVCLNSLVQIKSFSYYYFLNQVREWVEVEGNNRRRITSLRFEFLPRKSYKDRFCVTQERVLRYFENKFIHKVSL